MEKFLKKAEKFCKIGAAIAFIVCCFTSGMLANGQIQSSADDEVALQKEDIIKEIVQYQDGLNPFQSGSKSLELNDLSVDELMQLKNQGVKILIVKTISTPAEGMERMAEINKTTNTITVSLKADDGTVIDSVNALNI